MITTDRVLGVLCVFLVLLSGFITLSEFSVSWSWVLLLIWTFGLSIWTGLGWKKIEVGWRAQLLYLGQRMAATLPEGWRWIPWPFGLKMADCRQQIMTLDTFEAMTLDNVKVKIGATVTYCVDNLNTYFGVEASGIKKGIDDVRDALIRERVRKMSLNAALSSHRELGDELLSNLGVESTQWGIRILKVVIPEITPADQKVTDDLALKTREERQREGQRVELRHFTDRVTELMAPPPIGAGLSREQAIEQVQMSLGRATKNIDAKTITLDPTTAALVAAILGRRP